MGTRSPTGAARQVRRSSSGAGDSGASTSRQWRCSRPGALAIASLLFLARVASSMTGAALGRRDERAPPILALLAVKVREARDP